MLRIGKIELICILICLSPVFTTEVCNSIASRSNPSMTKYSSSFCTDRDDNIAKKLDRLQDIGEKWKSIEFSIRETLSMIYNKSLPFSSYINDNLDISRTCKQDIRKMLKGINQYENWAVQMLDSFGRLPPLIGTGTFSSFGDFDQCLDVNVPDNFQGQYCTLEFILPRSKQKKKEERLKELKHILSLIKPDGLLASYKKYFRFIHSVSPRTTICVPSTCSKEEMQIIATAAMKKMNFFTNVRVTNCEVKNKEATFNRKEILIMVILGMLFLLVMSSTACDIYLKSSSHEEKSAKKNLSLSLKYLLCFSLYKNTKELLKQDMKKDSIKVFHGMRVLTTLWVLLLHTCLYQNFQASSSLLFFPKSSEKLAFQFISNGFINVQTFFFMSGVLHAFQVMKAKEEINIKKHIFKRIWRLLPSSLLVIACVILIPHLGSGPVWKETMRDGLADKCSAKWWTHLLFINNFLGRKDACLEWLWSVAADFQIYVLSLLVLIPMKKNPRLALTINCFIMISTMAISAAFHLYYELSPMLVVALGDIEYMNYFIERGHFRTYLHFSSVCIGMAIGYFLATRPSNLQIPSKIRVYLWLASSSASLTAVLSVYKWSDGNIPSVAISATYAVASRVLWTSGIAWVTIACMTENGGFVTKILSLPIFVTLGRLCYMVYLIHSIIHFIYIGSTRSLIPMGPITVVYMFSATTVLSFSCAFVLTLFFELPFIALGKLIFDEKTSERIKRSEELDNRNPEGVLVKNAHTSRKNGLITE